MTRERAAGEGLRRSNRWALAWILSLIALNLLAIAFLELAHSGWLTDVCDRLEASPRSPGGFAVVGAAVVVPLVVSLLSRSVKLLVAGVVAAAASGALWHYLLTPVPC